jgi:hypothetical protein
MKNQAKPGGRERRWARKLQEARLAERARRQAQPQQQARWIKLTKTSRRAHLILLVAGLAILLSGVPTALSAQGRLGAEIQVSLISQGTVSGELIGINAEKMVLQVGPRERTVAISEVASVRVFRESLTPLAMVIGGVAGGFVGYAIGKKKNEPAATENPSSSQWVGAGVGAVAGAALGFLSGSLISHDKIYEFQGMSQEKIDAAIRELSKKARVPDFK